MKKIFFLLAAVCMMLVVCKDAHTPQASVTTASQQTTTGTTTVTQNTTTAPQTDLPVTQLPFSVEVETALRQVLELPEGYLTISLLKVVTELTTNNHSRSTRVICTLHRNMI